MKVKSFLIICSLIIYINTTESCRKHPASSVKDCKDLGLRENGDHCCYLKASAEIGVEKIEVSYCLKITQAEYDKIDETIKEIIGEAEREGGTAKVDTLDCKSSYIVLSLFSLLLLLL